MTNHSQFSRLPQRPEPRGVGHHGRTPGGQGSRRVPHGHLIPPGTWWSHPVPPPPGLRTFTPIQSFTMHLRTVQRRIQLSPILLGLVILAHWLHNSFWKLRHHPISKNLCYYFFETTSIFSIYQNLNLIKVKVHISPRVLVLLVC